MLYWQSNFQIPNSGTQSAEVYVHASVDADGMTARFYADRQLNQLLFEKQFSYTGTDPYGHLLSIPEFAQYTRVQ